MVEFASGSEVYIFATLGGGCGTGSLKAIAQEFKDYDYRLNFILTTPFKWEGIKKYEIANEVIEQIKNDFENVYVYSNNDLLNFGNLGIAECFKIQNENFNKSIAESSFLQNKKF